MSYPAERQQENETMIFDCVLNIVKNQPLDKLQLNVIEFLDFAKANEEYKELMCEQLVKLIIEYVNPYFQSARSKNPVFIPPEAAPVMMITTCIPMMDNAYSIIEGLSKFVERCNEFSAPIEDIITEREMRAVLEIAQKKFRILDIIALFQPIKIISLNNSHYHRNCECGISGVYGSREAVIFVYHPREVSVYDRVFIFAHEIGHALHLALTGDITQIPDGFDTFNEVLGIKGLSITAKQETFADAVAIALLNCDELKNHLPTQLLKQLPPYFERYILNVTSGFLKTIHFN